MQVKDAKGTDFASLFLNAFRQAAAEDGSNAIVHAMLKPRGNIMGVVFWDMELHMAAYVIPSPTISDMFHIYMAVPDDYENDIDQANNLFFTFKEGTRVYEYLGFDMNKSASEMFKESVGDLINFFVSMNRPAEFAAVIHEKMHQYKV